MGCWAVDIMKDANRVIEHWRSDLKADMRPGESMGTYFTRVGSETLEERFLFDTVAWSVFSHNLSPKNLLHFEQDKTDKMPAKKFNLAVLQGNVIFEKKKAGGLPPLWLDKTHGALRANCSEPPTFDELKAVFLEQLNWAIDKGADVVMAGEFAYPSSEDAIEIAALEEDIRSILRSTDRSIFMVAGSRHTPSDHGTALPHNANVAMIFGGDPTLEGFDKALENQPIPHYKRSPSISLGERIFSPVNAEIPVYKTPFSNFGVLVCSDAFDVQILFSFLRQNQRIADRAQFIFVPAFNESELFDDSCRYLSYLANATVIVANSYNGDFPGGLVKIFTSGVEASERAKCMAKRKDSFGKMDELGKNRIIEASKLLPASGSNHIKLGEYSRNVVLYEINRVHLETFSKILLKSGGRLVKKSLELNTANM